MARGPPYALRRRLSPQIMVALDRTCFDPEAKATAMLPIGHDWATPLICTVANRAVDNRMLHRVLVEEWTFNFVIRFCRNIQVVTENPDANRRRGILPLPPRRIRSPLHVACGPRAGSRNDVPAAALLPKWPTSSWTIRHSPDPALRGRR
jgi:hypothetical protein